MLLKLIKFILGIFYHFVYLFVKEYKRFCNIIIDFKAKPYERIGLLLSEITEPLLIKTSKLKQANSA